MSHASFAACTADNTGMRPIGMAFAPFLAQNKDGIFVHFARAGEVRWADKPYYEDPKVRQALLKKRAIQDIPLVPESRGNISDQTAVHRNTGNMLSRMGGSQRGGKNYGADTRSARGRFALRGGDNGKQVSRGKHSGILISAACFCKTTTSERLCKARLTHF